MQVHCVLVAQFLPTTRLIIMWAVAESPGMMLQWAVLSLVGTDQWTLLYMNSHWYY